MHLLIFFHSHVKKNPQTDYVLLLHVRTNKQTDTKTEYVFQDITNYHAFLPMPVA